MTSIVGRNVRIEVALTFAAAAVLTALSKANPGVATKASHGIADGTAGYLSMPAGMVEADLQAVLTHAAATDTFQLAGLDTTNYSTFTAGSFYAAATWGTLSESARYAVGGGAAAALDDTRLIHVKTVNVAGMLAPQDLTIDLHSPVISGTALAFLAAAAVNQTNCLFKITNVADGSILRVAYGQPSLPGEDVAAAAIGTGSFGVICPAFVTKPNV